MTATPLTIVLWTSAWTAIGWLASDRLAIGRESRFKRKRYRSFIELLRQKTESRFVGAFFLDHKTTFAEFDKEALEVRAHVCCKTRFDAACTAYKGVEFSILDDKKSAAGKDKLLEIIDEILASSGMFRCFFIGPDRGPSHPSGKRCRS